jgi:Methyltransferase FkbM domain
MLRSILNTTFDSLPLNQWIRKKSRIRTVRKLLKRLYPLHTDKELVRLGPKDDGGYLVPNDFQGIEACFSPGVGFVSGFEEACAQLGMEVFLADGSVDGPAVEHERFQFIKKFIGEGSPDEFVTLDDWVNSSIDSSSSDLMLQMDIEGAEYPLLCSASEALLRRFRIIVVEFHHLGALLNLSSRRYENVIKAFDNILKTHSCVHIHPNNASGIVRTKEFDIPKVMEFTFLRNDRITNTSYVRSFPHDLDCDNISRAPLVLPECWYAKRPQPSRRGTI